MKSSWKKEQWWVGGMICIFIGLGLWFSPNRGVNFLASMLMLYGGGMIGYYSGFQHGIIDELRRTRLRLRRNGPR